MSPDADPLQTDLVLAGGGVKGIAHVGALAALEDAGYRYERIAGTSAGSIAGSLAAAGMPAARMREVLLGLELREFRDPGLLDLIPVLGPALSILLEDGIFEGDRVHEWLGEQLAQLGVETFGDLKLPPDPDSTLAPNQRYRLVVMVADTTRGELVRLPWDYQSRYGLDPDRQRVADAVRASMSIPFFYEPVKLRHADGTESVLVDGGVLTNFPIDTFDRTDRRRPRWPTFGVTLIPRLPAGNAQLLPGLGLISHGPLRLLENLVTTTIVGHDQAELAKPWVAARTIEVDTSAVNAIDFDADREAQERLYASGVEATERFLSTWDWQEYLDRFRPPALA